MCRRNDSVTVFMRGTGPTLYDIREPDCEFQPQGAVVTLVVILSCINRRNYKQHAGLARVGIYSQVACSAAKLEVPGRYVATR